MKKCLPTLLTIVAFCVILLGTVVYYSTGILWLTGVITGVGLLIFTAGVLIFTDYIP